MESEKELSLEDLNNIGAGMPFEQSINRALDNKELFRNKQIEDLKKQKEYLKNLKEEQLKSNDDQIGTIKM